MELKDVILSTLAEMEEPSVNQAVNNQVEKKKEVISEKVEKEVKSIQNELIENSSYDSELIYLNSIRERLLVLFEGFQAPNNTNIEAKVDMTLNFLEYVLATIDSRVEVLKKGETK